MAEKSNEKKLEELYKHFQSDKFKKDLINLILRIRMQSNACEFYSIDNLIKNR